VTGYRLYLGGSHVGTSLSTSYVFSGLTCGTSYTLGVAAVDAAGNVSGTATIAAATASCSPPPPGSCTTTISSGLAAAIQNASAGATICLNSGSYGALTFTSLSKSSDVTVRPAAGANVTIGSVILQNVSHLHFTGAGGSLSVGSTRIDQFDTRPNCSSHLTFDYLRFSVGISIYPRCAAMDILVDHDNLNNLLNHDGWDGRLNVQALDQGPSTDQGITISNSTFNGGCSKGMQILGDAYGVQVLNNEFANLSQSGCDPLHVGGIQIYGGVHTHLKGNYFHDNGDSAGGLSMPANASDFSLVEDNVWVCTCIYPWSIQAAATHNSTFVHNTFAGGGGIHFYTEQGSIAANNVVRDNVFTNPDNGITWDSVSRAWGTNDHNLNSGMSGTGNVTGIAVFVPSPASGYSHYQLASSSPGSNAASDGTDMGIR
jgi:hypothetical protein